MIQVRRGVASGNACGPPLGDRRADRLGASRTPRSAAGDPGVPAWLLEGVSEEIRVPFKLLSWHDDKKPDMSQTFSKKCFTGCMAFDILFHAPKSAAVRAVSSGVEHYLDTVGVTSSNLVSPTTNSTGHREVPVACFAISRRCEAQALGGPFLGIHTSGASDAMRSVRSDRGARRPDSFLGPGSAPGLCRKGGAAGAGDLRDGSERAGGSPPCFGNG